MRTVYLALVAALLLALAPPAAAQAVRTLSRTVPLAADGRVSIDTHKGSVTVETWNRAEASIEVRIEGDDEDAVARTQVHIHSDANRLRLKTDYDDVQNNGLFSLINAIGGNVEELPETHYTLMIPRSARLDIDDHKSEIRVTNLAAPLDVDSHKGRIAVERIDGDLRIDSHKGRMVVDGVRGHLTLDTHKGQADIRALEGPLRLDTHKGDVRVAFAEFGGARVGTHKGTVRLALPSGAGFDLDADLDDDGTLHADFDLASLRRGRLDDDEQRYRGAVNGGGPALTLSTHKGSYAVRLR